MFWKPTNSIRFTILGQTIWIVLVAYGCSFLGAFQVPIFGFSLTYALAGIIYDIRSRNQQQQQGSINNVTFFQQITTFLESPIYYISGSGSSGGASSDSINTNSENNIHQNIEKPTSLPLTSTSSYLEPVIRSKDQLNVTTTDDTTNKNELKEEPNEEEHLLSDFYFKILFYACAATVFYNNFGFGLLILLFIPVCFYYFIHFCTIFGLKKFLTDKIQTTWNLVWVSSSCYCFSS